MKTIATLLLSLFMSCMVHAQSAIAKIKYEEAEEAYSKDDYQTALAKVEETEKILKSSNPKTLYLKIVSQHKLADTDFSIIQSLKKNCNTYLVKYESNEGIEDKFREVYKISESVKKYPATEEAFQVWADEAKKKKQAEEAAQKEKMAGGVIAEKFTTWLPMIEGVRIGMKSSEIPSSARRFLDFGYGMALSKGQYGVDRDCIIYTAKYKAMKIKSSVGMDAIYIDKANDQVISVSKKHMVGGKGSIEESKNVYDALVAKMKAHFGAENVVEQEVTNQIDKKSSYYTKTATLKENPVSQYTILQNIMYYGGMLGTECYVSESFSVMKITANK